MIRRLLIFTSLCLIGIRAIGQTEQLTKDTIVSRFLKGDIIVINDWALAGPADFFDSVTISSDSFRAIQLDKDSALNKYGYFGNNFKIYELTIPSFDSLTYGYFVDATIFKYLNPEKKKFYFIDGAPCWEYSNAIELILNKKIIKIQKIEVEQAQAIWGPDGKNGALLINTDKKPSTLVIFK